MNLRIVEGCMNEYLQSKHESVRANQGTNSLIKVLYLQAETFVMCHITRQTMCVTMAALAGAVHRVSAACRGRDPQ